MVENFTAHITPFGLDRNTFVYLPDDWQSSGRRYPVVYMFDGHNLFFDSTATYGTCWGLKEYMDTHPQAIIVAPECNHEGNARLEEYSPYDFVWQEYDIKGRGKAYLDWMVQELKPLIDAKYPTLPDRENTAIGGSSMGGLMSLYGITAHNETFSRAACLSPSVRFSFTEVKAGITANQKQAQESVIEHLLSSLNIYKQMERCFHISPSFSISSSQSASSGSICLRISSSNSGSSAYSSWTISFSMLCSM